LVYFNFLKEYQVVKEGYNNITTLSSFTVYQQYKMPITWGSTKEFVNKL